MGSMSPIHWVILAVIVLVLFGGGGKISSLMGDFAKGIKSFKKGMAEDDKEGASPAQTEERLAPPAQAPQAGQPNVPPQGQPTQHADVRMADDEPQHPPRS
ncbi:MULTISPECIES: twin-arginine translocase TatA/TatE family subunit [Bombella]|uniref:Sec-independent protein translocase protein TatA n=1 Tax=Bombella pollinis TaxID=2967337 RepID=A0ABT3WMI8_9PROT|nr:MULTISPECIES: twin-arginine translocase TatA/TatE family subunit [Bombella]MCT6854994.1 twin-arginine translocase TatA/TatE family subunit [Bombella apis]MCX5620332.1 twin-arginine translocase TatA/TatE family subunit [Bombella pollinis]MUG05338.1 twin-arginine translocase TatA/TatE family subunit [Bombella sp. ESL0378]MUG90885.1 twin-arginine translocase TatA/TatE family subunit [Bombella sp. ESL0385]